MNEEIQNTRLQLLRHDELFANREEALEYIDNNYTPNALIAEPVVVFYGEKAKPNAILAIGATNKRVFILDANALKEEIEANSEKVGEDAGKLKELMQSVDEIVKASGLVFDPNKIADRITYNAPVRDEVIGEAKTLAEAIAILSQFVQNIEKGNQSAIADSKSITLIEEDVKGVKTLSAEVKISEDGEDDDVAFNDNIVGLKPDGLFAAVNLRHDVENNRLIFTCSGMKNGKFVTDAKRRVIELGEAPTAKNMAYDDETTVYQAIKDMSKAVSALEGLEVSVNASKNTLTVKVGEQEKTVELPGVDIIQSVKYDKKLHSLTITFKNGNLSVIPLDDIFKENHFTNSDTLKLHEHVNEDGSSTIYGDVILSNREENVLKKDESGLYVEATEVGGVSMRDVNDAVREETDRAKEVEREIKDLVKEEATRAKGREAEIEQLVKDETTARERADEKNRTELEQLIKDEVTAREHGDEKNAIELREAVAKIEADHATSVRDEKDRAMAAEAAISSLLDSEIAERRADVKRVETEAIPALQQLLIDKIQEEIDRAKDAEHTIAESVIAEKSRAELREAEIESEISSATTKADYAAAQVDAANAAVQAEAARAIEKEHALELTINSNKEALDKELADRKEGDAVQNSNIKELQDKMVVLEGPASQVGSIRSIISEEMRLSDEGLHNEIERAKTAEEILGQRIDGIVNNNSDTLNAAKEYTNTETARAKEVEDAIKADVVDLKAKDAELADALAAKVGDVKIEKLADNDLVYQLLVDDKPAGLINIPQDHFFKGATFNEATHILKLSFSTPEQGVSDVDIDMSSLIQAYRAGAGIGLSEDSKFYIVKNEQGDEGYLFVDENGICVKGINAALATKADVGASYTKAESDAEYEKLRGEDAAIKSDVTLMLNDAKTAIAGEISQVDQKVEAEAVRAKAKEEVIENTVASHKEATDAAVQEAKTELAGVKAKAENNEKAIAEEKSRAELVEHDIQNSVANIEEKVNTLTGPVGAPGSVLDNIQKAKDEINSAVNAEVERAKAEEVRLHEAIDSNNAAALTAISEAKDAAIAHTDRELVDVKAGIAKNAADIDTKVGSVKLEQPDGGADYLLIVDGVNIGTIRTQQRGGVLTGVTYNNGILTLVFNVDGEVKTEQIDFHDLLSEVKDYKAGDGLHLDGTTFRVVKDHLSEDFLEVSESGIGIHGVQAAIDAAAKAVQDSVDEVKASIIEINTSLNTVKLTAESANQSANEAKAVADTAKTTAEGAVATANEAKGIAELANEKAESASDDATKAVDAAERAETAATEAKTAATEAQTTAGGMSDLVANAKAAAEKAEQVAAEAKQTADSIKSRFDTVESDIADIKEKLDDPVVDYGTY